jgi:hypothetical protein
MKPLLITLVIAVSLTSCWDFYGRPGQHPGKVLGYKPVYSQDPNLVRIYTDTPRAVKVAGKIYALGNLVLQNEQGQGIHILDRSDPANVRNLSFLRIIGNTEMSIKGNHLYANSFDDLVVVDISNWQNIKEVKRIPRAFRQGGNFGHNYTIPPPEHNKYFECIDPSKGIQVGWVKDSVEYYSCYYN